MSAALLARVQQRIRERGPLPFSEYMDLALYDPQAGYCRLSRFWFGCRFWFGFRVRFGLRLRFRFFFSFRLVLHHRHARSRPRGLAHAAQQLAAGEGPGAGPRPGGRRDAFGWRACSGGV